MPAQLRDARGRFARPPAAPEVPTSEDQWLAFWTMLFAVLSVPLVLAGWLAYAVLTGATIIGILYCLHLAFRFILFGSI